MIAELQKKFSEKKVRSTLKKTNSIEQDVVGGLFSFFRKTVIESYWKHFYSLLDIDMSPVICNGRMN